MYQLRIDVTDDDIRRLKQIAHEHGFDSPEAYLKAVALEPSKEELLDDIRQGLLAIKRGEPMQSLDEMWAEVENDDD